MIESKSGAYLARVMIAGLVLGALGRAQVEDRPEPMPLAPQLKYLKPGQKFEGAMGRIVHNADSRSGGYRVCLQVARSSQRATKTRPAITKGEILRVVVPNANGSNHVIVDSSGRSTTVVVNKGPRGGASKVVVSTTGGRVTLELNGRFAEATMGGPGNRVLMNGSDNQGKGRDGTSSGTVVFSRAGRNNSWAGAPGSWSSRI